MRRWKGLGGRGGRTGAVLALATVLLAACGGNGARGPARDGADGVAQVHIGVLRSGLTLVPPQRLADDPELQRKHKLKVDVRHFANLQELFPGMASGAVDATIAAPSGLAAQAIQGAPLQVIGTGISDASLVLLGKGGPITSADQLRGKRITAPASSGTWRVMQAQIDRKFGLQSGKDYRIVAVNDVVAGATQVAAGTADYALSWEPFVTQSLNKASDLKVVLTASSLKDYVSWQLLVGVDAKMSDDVKRRLVAALADAGTWAQANPAAADKAYGKLCGYEPGLVEKVLSGKSYAFDIHPLAEADVKSIQTDLQLAVEQGALQKMPAGTFLFR